MGKYYYISLKWTHKTDAFITLWRGNSDGYCWYRDWTGVYNDIGDGFGVYTVEKELVDKLWVKVDYDGEEREVLPNTDDTLQALGLLPRDFLKAYPSECPNVKSLNRYLI